MVWKLNKVWVAKCFVKYQNLLVLCVEPQVVMISDVRLVRVSVAAGAFASRCCEVALLACADSNNARNFAVFEFLFCGCLVAFLRFFA